MREIVIDKRGKIMDEGCGTCSHCKPTGNGWVCVFAEDENGNQIGIRGCDQAREQYHRIKSDQNCDLK